MKKPNIILIVMDTARAANFSCYGYPETTTPNIDKIAKEGTLYQYAISPSTWTLPSHVSLFTGLYTSEHGVTGLDPATTHLSQDYMTIAQFLSKCGYQTIGYSNNPWISKLFGLTKGFDFFKLMLNDRMFFDEDLLEISDTVSKLENQNGVKKYVELVKIISKNRNRFKNFINAAYYKFSVSPIRYLFRDDGAKETTKQVIDWINKRGTSKPFFLFINYMECHAEYIPPKKYRPKNINLFDVFKLNRNPLDYLFGKIEMPDNGYDKLEALYNGEYRYLDSKIGELYKSLKDNKLLDDTVLIITSDHGENLGEHNLLGHTFSAYNTLLHVPLIIRYPPLFPANEKITSEVQSLDIFETIRSIVDTKTKIITSGKCIIPKNISNKIRPLFSEYPGHIVSQLKKYNRQNDCNFSLSTVQISKYKYIRSSKGVDELYDLEADPGENYNIINEYSDVANELKQALVKFERKNKNKNRLKSKIKNLRRSTKTD